MNDPIALTLNSPITDEQWDAITDVDFEHTERIWFKTKHGKEVEFVKRKSGRWIEENRRPKSMMFYCSECHRTAYDPQNHHGGQKQCRYAFCPNCGADMRTKETDRDYERSVEQLEHDMLYEPTYDPDDGSM